MENSLLLDVLDVLHGVSVGISRNPVGLFSRHRVGDVGVEVDISYVNDSQLFRFTSLMLSSWCVFGVI